jgi:large subunit ribosomal protein L9
MKVILQQDLDKVGKEHDIVSVADGFARNYLFPRGLAVKAEGGALKNLQMRQALEERRAEQLRAQADQAAAKLDGKTVTIRPAPARRTACTVRSPRRMSPRRSKAALA